MKFLNQVLKALQDKPNRFADQFEYLNSQYAKHITWIALLCGLIACVHGYQDVQHYGLNQPLGYLSFIAAGILFISSYLSYKFPTFSYKSFIFQLVMLIYLTVRLSLFHIPLPPTIIWLLLFPLFSAYTISLGAHTLFFLLTVLIMSINFFTYYTIPASASSATIMATELQLRSFSNFIIFSFILYFFVRHVIKNEEHSYKLLEHKLAENSHIAKLSSLGEMSGAIAHEINNPLQILLGAHKLLHKKSENTEQIASLEIKKLQQPINSALLRMEGIIRTMLNLTRKDNIKKRDTNFNEIYELFFPLIKNRLIDKNIKFHIDQKLFNSTIHCNPEAIAQVFINLMTNAIDAVVNLDSPWIKIELHEQEHWLDILLIDAGTGIDQAISNKIFEPFFTTKDVNKGTGLGLSVIHRIITDQNGKVQYRLKDGHTCFEVLLPKD